MGISTEIYNPVILPSLDPDRSQKNDRQTSEIKQKINIVGLEEKKKKKKGSLYFVKIFNKKNFREKTLILQPIRKIVNIILDF